MNQQAPRRSLPNGWSWTNIWRDLVATWRLLWDPSVPSILKLTLPLMALVYWISPLDLIPMMPLDDIAVLMLAARLFVALAPRASVDRAFNGGTATPPPNSSRPGAPRPESGQGSGQGSGEVIDTTWRIVE